MANPSELQRFERGMVANREVNLPSITEWVDKYETEDYPYGRLRTHAEWVVDGRKGKMRVLRVTVNPKTGRENKPKKLTYGAAAKIGLGSDGRTYVFIGDPGQITVYGGNFKYLGSLFTGHEDYEKVARAMGIQAERKETEVKRHENGATIDGLQGQTSTIREILEIAGFDTSDVTDIERVRRKAEAMYDRFTVEFKSDRPDFVIMVRV